MLSLLQLSFYSVPEEDEIKMMNLDLPAFLWQERCERRFGFCKEYWNLPWTEDVTSPAQRYLSLKADYGEPQAYDLAGEEGEYDLLRLRMLSLQDDALIGDIREFFTQRRDKKAKAGEAKCLFRTALLSGKEEYVNEMVHQMYIWTNLDYLPETIDKVVKPIPFSANFSSKDYIIPDRREEVFSSSHLIDAVRGGNVRIVLYIQEHSRLRRDDLNLQEELIQAYIRGSSRGFMNPQGFYSILQYLHEVYRQTTMLYKIETGNKDHLLFVLQKLTVSGQNPKEININQERVLRKNAIRSIRLARAFSAYLTLDMLNLMKEDRRGAHIRRFALKRIEKGKYLRGPIIYGGDISDKNLSILPFGLKI